MNRPLLDSDEEIVKRAGMSIPDLFAKYGEEYFRALETQVLQDLCKESGCIIATGGGAVLREENRLAMRQNGRLCLIRRALENLPRSGRPLSKSQDALQEMWNYRKPIYESSMDFSVENNADKDIVAQTIEEGFYEAVGNERT